MAIKLNLGCGKKLLDGYINVDAIERDGCKPEVIADVTNLDSVFSDNYADEILSVHVIEHVYYWQAEEMLRDWVRILKPGGLMIIECPNLLESCKMLVNAGQEASLPDKRGQQTMWPLYGDPNHKDPYMMHKWGYTPYSLAHLMQQCGLVNVGQRPAMLRSASRVICAWRG